MSTASCATLDPFVSVRRVLEHRPVEKQYVTETKFVGGCSVLFSSVQCSQQQHALCVEADPRVCHHTPLAAPLPVRVLR